MRCTSEQIYRRMRYLVERDKLYLDPHLSLNRLSTITGTNTLYLSRAINVCTGRNFKTMLNDYRIKHAKALLADNARPRFSFKDFHAQCGFLSKSAFYSSFKKRMNMTPKEYLVECLSKSVSGGELELVRIGTYTNPTASPIRRTISKPFGPGLKTEYQNHITRNNYQFQY